MNICINLFKVNFKLSYSNQYISFIQKYALMTEVSIKGCSRIVGGFFQWTLPHSGLDKLYYVDSMIMPDSRCVSFISQGVETFFERANKVRKKVT